MLSMQFLLVKCHIPNCKIQNLENIRPSLHTLKKWKTYRSLYRGANPLRQGLLFSASFFSSSSSTIPISTLTATSFLLLAYAAYFSRHCAYLYCSFQYYKHSPNVCRLFMILCQSVLHLHAERSNGAGP